ncbi:four helix bundle protein [Candidatus Roizmanbacteria bacterium]|nr:four helix bundle protein [Candidatus Roizmanbacteria bacterium]
MKNQNTGFGYEKLIVYWIATSIYDLTVIFCDRYIDKRSRTHDQMVQAARSGKQNIVEGSLSKSHESNIKLADVSHNSYGELLEDYKDYLRQKELTQWTKEDPRILQIRKTYDLPYKTYTFYTTYTTYMQNHEAFANLMLTLCYKQIYLMSQFLKANQERFIKEGGFRENLFKKRLEYRKQI